MVAWPPQGIHHGPHPKAIPLSRTKDHTVEVAVMVDTFRPLQALPAAELVENIDYWASWKKGRTTAGLESRPSPAFGISGFLLGWNRS
jgi:homogentisate 1,2-dioxygenase